MARVPVVGAMTPFFAGAVGEALVEATITDEAATTILATPSEVQIACAHAFTLADIDIDIDIEPELALRAMSMPVLTFHGDADATAPIGLADHATSALRFRAERRVCPGAPPGPSETRRGQLQAGLLAVIPSP